MTIPGYIVKRSEEPTIAFNANSPLSNELHPMRPKLDTADRPGADSRVSPVQAPISPDSLKPEKAEEAAETREKEEGGE